MALNSPPSTRQSSALVCSVIKELLKNGDYIEMLDAAISKAVDKAFVKLDDRIEALEGQMHDLQTDCDNKAHQIAVLKKEMSKQADRIDTLVQAQWDMEQYSRRNCIRIFGVREREGESTDDILCDISKKDLGLAINPEKDIDRSHRTGRKKADTAAPRPIIVKLTSYRKRQEILKRRRHLKGSGVSIHEDLTKRNVDLLRKASQHAKVKAAWSSDGRIIAEIPATNGRTVKKLIRCESDLKNL
ncbi:uncharacterized protein [Diadema setosum]|uniref:uncharacterized protein n=1 Tax=Diadema setosum TaxID=31175 RepID=UPI003B3BDD48